MNVPINRIVRSCLPYVAAISLSVMVGLISLAASINTPPTDPFGATDQPVRRNLAQIPDRSVALSSVAVRTSADYWLEVGRALGAF